MNYNKIEKAFKSIEKALEQGKEQGGTFTLKGKKTLLEGGYMVGATRLFLADKDIYTIEDIKTILGMLDINNSDGIYIGFWVNENIIYWDITYHFNTLKYSLKFAKKMKELAIWDNENKKTITIN